jgi:molybdopterin-guanine dinucleotide biosynthesis protein MobB
MNRIHIVGRKNSGKTTLIVDLVERLTQMGLAVGTVKHTHHHHELDMPGKDSYRHRAAGARPVAILSPGMSAIFRPTLTGQADEGYAWIDAAFQECDLVLVEGNSQTDRVKLEVWRAETQTPPMALADPTIRALISDDSVDIPIPRWSRRDLTGLVDHLREVAGLSDR